MIATTIAVCLTFTCPTLAQSHEDLLNECNTLENAALPDIVQYLNSVIPDEKNGDCVTWAIRKLGNERYEPAIIPLVRLLDFRRPLTPREKRGYFMHPHTVDEMYPAANALELIGKSALPEVLHAIEAASTSATARENAVSVWMEAYKYERPKGVALLKQEETKASNDAIKQKIRWALRKALTYCGEQDEAACRQAAATGI